MRGPAATARADARISAASVDHLAGRLVDVPAGARGEAAAHHAGPLVLVDGAHGGTQRPAVRHRQPHAQEMPSAVVLRIILEGGAGVETGVVVEELQVARLELV